MRSVFVFTNAARLEVEAVLNRLGVRSDDRSWVIDAVLWVRIDEPPPWADGWEEHDREAISSALGSEPHRLVTIDVSGRIDGRSEVISTVAELLGLGGIAQDDWDGVFTPEEIEQDLAVNGRRFFVSPD